MSETIKCKQDGGRTDFIFCPSLFPVHGKCLAHSYPDSISLESIDCCKTKILNSTIFKIFLLLKHYSSLKKTHIAIERVTCMYVFFNGSVQYKVNYDSYQVIQIFLNLAVELFHHVLSK